MVEAARPNPSTDAPPLFSTHRTIQAAPPIHWVTRLDSSP
ncbi:hypothetical protein D187_002475 [Cystobacter fuscus DSM 2262]|uniref:Uncharacterized protein n=1 Tax=Cystobacter fuscus (strain ATCC 25194 / DSM 2262 / NBRC 100088 / M29) TaxID=1242864 RepID=S9P9E9_CYSF2|nr:hypothetical protein D187_002475 [Cystobacter fuscus DSM 2262]